MNNNVLSVYLMLYGTWRDYEERGIALGALLNCLKPLTWSRLVCSVGPCI